MYSCADTLAGGLPHSDIHGSTPARGSPWLFAACHVLHRLLVPRHPPNALLILDIPDIRPVNGEASPCTETILRPGSQAKPARDDPGNIHSAPFGPAEGHAQHDASRIGYFADSLAQARRKIHPTRSFTAPLNPRRPTVGALVPCRTALPGQTHRPNDGTSQPDPTTTRAVESHAPRDAPEPDSHFQRTTRPPKRPHTTSPHIQDIMPRPVITSNSNIRDTALCRPHDPHRSFAWTLTPTGLSATALTGSAMQCRQRAHAGI